MAEIRQGSVCRRVNEGPVTEPSHCRLASYRSKCLVKNGLVACEVSGRGRVIGMWIVLSGPVYFPVAIIVRVG